MEDAKTDASVTTSDLGNTVDLQLGWRHTRQDLWFAFITALFIGSGLSSLIYQVIWTRLLVLVFGSTTFATATVLAVFMGGLALGSYLAGRVADRIKRPYLWYGILEGVIGLWAILVPFMFDAAVPLYRIAWQEFHLSVLPFSLLRFVMAAIILLVPTTCMGATLPLLARFVTDSLSYVGRHVGSLYAANTLGAVGGALLAGLVLLPAIGMNATTLSAAGINLLLCAVVVASASRIEKTRETEAPPAEVQTEEKLPAQVGWVIVAFAFSGAIAMIYEVGWTRSLLMVIGSSTYSFTVMLSSFLVGIFLGSLICARFVDRAKEPIAWFAVLQFLICLFGFAAMIEFNFLPWWNLSINAATPSNPALSLGVRFVLAAAILLPLTLCLGAIFPVVVRIAATRLEVVGRSVGTLYSANTLGAIVGAFLAGFVLVPLLGVEKTLIFACLTNMFIGIGLLCFVGGARPVVKVAAVAAGVAVAFWTLKDPVVWDRVVLLSAQAERRQLLKYRLGFPTYDTWSIWLHQHAQCIFWEDGASSNVGVLQYNPSGQRSLVTNGHIDASDTFDMAVQVLISACPLLFKPEVKDVAVVGWGSGVTVGTATLFPLESITAIELEPAVINGARYFRHVNHSPEENKLVRLEYNDGRNYLLATDRKFDVVVSEPSNPWQPGVCNLFTREYFQICKQRLKPGGIFAFWLQTVEIPPANMRQVLSALRSVYRYNMALLMTQGNTVVLASDSPLTIDWETVQKRMNDAKVKAELTSVGVPGPENLIARIQATPEGIDEIAAGVEPNVDDTNRLEYAVGKSYENAMHLQDNIAQFDRHRGHPANSVSFGSLAPVEKARVISKVAEQAAIIGRYRGASDWAAESIKVIPTPEGYRVRGIALFESGHRTEAREAWHQALRLDPNHIETLQTRGLTFLIDRDLGAARADFMRVLAIEPANKAALYHMAQTYDAASHTAAGQQQEAAASNSRKVLEYVEPVLTDKEFIRRHSDALYMAGAAYARLGQFEQAEAVLRKFVAADPKAETGRRMLSSVLTILGKRM